MDTVDRERSVNISTVQMNAKREVSVTISACVLRNFCKQVVDDYFLLMEIGSCRILFACTGFQKRSLGLRAI